MTLMSRSVRARLIAVAATGVVALAGCGGDDEPTSGGGGGAPDVDAAALLRDGMLKFSKDGKPIKSGTFAFTVSGKVNAPEDDELKGIDGKAVVTLSVDAKPADAELPPLSVKVDVDGGYTNPDGTRKPGKYNAGVSFIDNQFYANWDGADYAVGEALSKQALDEFDKEVSKNGELPELPDSEELTAAMDLNPETWLTNPTAADGGTLDGVQTYKVTGDVAIEPMVEDVVEGLRKLPDALPSDAGAGELRDLKDLSDEDLKRIEEVLDTAEVTLWVGAEDRLQRRLLIRLVGKDEKEPVDFDLTIQIDSSKLDQPQGLKAPAQAAPITDLIVKLEEEFGSLLSGLGAGTGA